MGWMLAFALLATAGASTSQGHADVGSSTQVTDDSSRPRRADAGSSNQVTDDSSRTLLTKDSARALLKEVLETLKQPANSQQLHDARNPRGRNELLASMLKHQLEKFGFGANDFEHVRHQVTGLAAQDEAIAASFQEIKDIVAGAVSEDGDNAESLLHKKTQGTWDDCYVKAENQACKWGEFEWRNEYGFSDTYCCPKLDKGQGCSDGVTATQGMEIWCASGKCGWWWGWYCE